jgi:hypothetical protein
MKDYLKLTGKVHFLQKDGQGNVILDRTVDNLVVDAGRNWLWLMATSGAPPAKMGWMALGTGTTAPANADVALQTETASTRVATSNNGTVTTTACQFVCTYNPGVATGTITEAGIFNAATAGTMLAHVTFGTITKNAADTLSIAWTITLS